MNWEERETKKKTRAWLIDQLDFDRPIHYAGLPAAEALFETELCERVSVKSMFLFEVDEAVHEQATQAVEALRAHTPLISVWKYDVDEWIRTEGFPKTPKDFIWLDYCGYVNIRRLASLKKCIETMPEDGVVAATFLAMRELKEQQDLLYVVGSKGQHVVGGEPTEKHLTRIRTVTNVGSSVGYPLRIKVLPYYDKSPMLLFVFSRKNVRRTTIEVLPQMKE